MVDFHLATERLVLRSWRTPDRRPFAAMNADPEVMEFLDAPLSRSESDALVERFEVELATRGFCPWAVEEQGSGAFIGFVGLHEVSTTLAFSPAVEVGWRLARPFWGRGYATEAAQAALGFGFESVGVAEIVSMTAVANVRSQRVMERLGMSRDPDDDFEHPSVRVSLALKPHVLYRLTTDAWRARLDTPTGSAHP